jgi:sorting nexin-5/6/32
MFEKMSERARDELRALKSRRVASIQKSLSDLAELELKHSKAHAQMLKVTIASLKADI